ncbi:MAG TPA: limonene-1,2-epoxide hydrolase family protein [Acidimicrobiia bacterium]|nr:limonene-1,2-epoxide hydrolase family protein [Acidimicrobiia bacterium]
MAEPEQVVREFCAAWSDLDRDHLMAFFAPDAVYHNMPVDPVVGTDAIRAFVESFTASVDHVSFEILHSAAAGPVVLTERVDTFVAGDRSIGLPVMGTFEVHDGKITAWRDYFDMAQAMTAVGMG